MASKKWQSFVFVPGLAFALAGCDLFHKKGESVRENTVQDATGVPEKIEAYNAFPKIDADRDGFATEQEISSYDANYGRQFGIMDENKDAKVSEDEFRRYSAQETSGGR